MCCADDHLCTVTVDGKLLSSATVSISVRGRGRDVLLRLQRVLTESTSDLSCVKAIWYSSMMPPCSALLWQHSASAACVLQSAILREQQIQLCCCMRQRVCDVLHARACAAVHPLFEYMTAMHSLSDHCEHRYCNVQMPATLSICTIMQSTRVVRHRPLSSQDPIG